MRILVVGGSGFIGTRLTRELLKAGHQVVVFDKRRAANDGVKYLAGDVRDADALRRAVDDVETIFHLAAEHTDDLRDTGLYHDVNVGGMRNLTAVCREAPAVSKIIFTSTVACYGLDATCPDEQTPPSPFNEYGRSKLLAEKVLFDWTRETGKQAVVVRPSVVFGEANRGNVYNLLRQIHRRRFAMVGDGTNRKSMAYVENTVDFLVWCHVYVKSTEVFNYADKPDLSTAEIVSIARKEMGLKGGLVRVPYPLALLMGRGCDVVSAVTGRSLPFSEIRVRKFCAETTVDATKAHGAGFTPRYSLEHGLQTTIASEFARG